MKRVADFFILCSGANTSLLERCPTERSKYAGLGATIFFTGLFAFASAAYALFTVFNNYFIAIALGLVWGLMIFNLDRYIVSSMRKEGRFLRELTAAVPRIIIAIIISVVIAKPLELRIFEKEINPELEVMEQKAYAMQEQEVRNRYSTQAAELRGQKEQLMQEIAEKSSQRDELVKIAQEEADGTGGSKRRNLGPIYKIKKADADKSDAELQQMLTANLANIQVIDSKLTYNDSLMRASLSELRFQKRDGPAARMEALNTLKTQSLPIWWASVFIMLLVMAVETAPVFVKLISGKGPYDNLLKMEEFKFTAEETESLAQSSAAVRKGMGAFPQEESDFVQKRLDEALKKA